ncbi:MAG TPA: dephospho-CoA kinase [Terriglobia bacterium]|nr:dephospho-CoA kinase [Terriglobia bacterium]
MSYFGLTGGIASGKSTVAGMLEGLGAKTIDADRVGHELLRPPEPAFREIVQRFGAAVLNSAGEIDRRLLGANVFADPQKLRELNAIVHPRIIARTEELAARFQAEDPRAVVVIDAALIFEAGIGSRFRKVIVAWCRPEQQVARLMAKMGVSREEAESRIAAQMPVDEKRSRADYLIDCSGSKEETRAQVEALYPQLQRLMMAAP